MKDAVITTKHSLLDGGCNACGFVECTTHTLQYNGQELPVSDLDVENLVATIVRANQWKESYEPVGIGDDAVVFKKEMQKVAVTENGKFLTYKNTTANKSTLAENKLCDDCLFDKVNEVLALFTLPPVQFSFAE
ncbi:MULTISPECIES: DUF4809 family protein [Enterococcus]|uniref:DUF4809 family protein n=1 Tax=Enterococcus TaxID=1350 RepID=UPI0010F7AEB1|nr:MULTISPECIES: DUF4809 family protein [Enterococcus]KAF1301268.1 hypothetical protein BAU16_09730 [Enterococcus sp. JM9B]